MKALLLAGAIAAGALPPAKLDAEIAAAIDLFYDLEFEKAAVAANRIAANHPGHPAGPFYRSIVFYQRFLAEEPKRRETLESFERHCEDALDAAERLRREDPAQGHYYLGIAKGFRARVLAAQKRYLKAIPEGLGAVRQLKKALAIDPNIEDAYLGLGMYHYFTARIPAGAKPFAFMLGAGWGDREKGLEYLSRAAEKGGPARMEARSMLSSVYTLESRWDKADAYLAELTERYPRNPLYRMRRIYVNQRWGKLERALELSDPNGRWFEKIPQALKPIALAPALYRSAESELVLGRPERAAAHLARLEAMTLPEALGQFALVRRGNLLDWRGRREQALALYRSVTHKHAQRLAKSFIETPYPGGTKDVMPWLGLETPH